MPLSAVINQLPDSRQDELILLINLPQHFLDRPTIKARLDELIDYPLAWFQKICNHNSQSPTRIGSNTLLSYWTHLRR